MLGNYLLARDPPSESALGLDHLCYGSDDTKGRYGAFPIPGYIMRIPDARLCTPLG
jgi:hypothetical protein